MSKQIRVVLTGGPGAGKTTAADLLRREVGDRIVVVPETATMLFGGGFPRRTETEAKCHAQEAIYHVQRRVEEVFALTYPDRALLCDRGTVDGAAYFPGSPETFFASLNTSLEAELERYDQVIFFETAAVGGISIEGGNPVRNEDTEQAVALDGALRALWSQHPRFTLVEHQKSFLDKTFAALKFLMGIIENGVDGEHRDTV